MVNLKANPFFLNDEEIRWVEDTIASMTPEEKLSQLFVLLKPVPGADEGQIKNLMEGARPGGMRWQGGDKETVWLQNRLFQRGHLCGDGRGSRRVRRNGNRVPDGIRGRPGSRRDRRELDVQPGGGRV